MSGEVRAGIALLALLALLLLLVLAACRAAGLWTRAAAWLSSSREEKAALTRTRGFYDANGCFVSSDSDIQLSSVGDLKRPPTFSIPGLGMGAGAVRTSSLSGPPPPPIPPPPSNIPPQPLRPAPPAPPLVAANTPPLLPVPSPPLLPPPLPPPPLLPPVLPPPPPPVPPPPSPAPPPQPPADTCDDPDVPGERLPPALSRAASCDSVCSDTSVALGDLQEPNVTGYLCVGLEYDSEAADLVVSVLEAKELMAPGGSSAAGSGAPLDSYVRVYLLPDKTSTMQTRVYRRTNCPSYKEKFLFALEHSECASRALSFYVYACDRTGNTLIGEAEVKLSDVNARQPVTTWLTLTDGSGLGGAECGELMFSLSYLPTAERLTVVVVKARNLRFPGDRGVGDPFVKVYLLQHGKKVHKKKTSTKRTEQSPIFNEAIIFSVPAHTLQTIQLRLTVAESATTTSSGSASHSHGRARAVGHVIVGSQATGRALSHWNQMLSSLRKPIAMWHPLRK